MATGGFWNKNGGTEEGARIKAEPLSPFWKVMVSPETEPAQVIRSNPNNGELHRRTVSPNRAGFANASRQRDARQDAGAQRRGLPKRIGNWPTISTRMNRWSKSGVLDRVSAQLQHTPWGYYVPYAYTANIRTSESARPR